MNSDLYFIGIDGGGTKCRVILQDKNGTHLGEGISGPANIMRDAELAKTSILDGVDKLLSLLISYWLHRIAKPQSHPLRYHSV